MDDEGEGNGDGEDEVAVEAGIPMWTEKYIEELSMMKSVAEVFVVTFKVKA